MEIWQDVRYGFRMLRKSPGFTTVAVVTLSLGIGINTSMFSIVEASLFAALPYPESSALVRVFRTSPHSQRWPHSAANFLDQQAKSTAFERMAAFSWWTFNVGEPGQPPERVEGIVATAELFPTLGVKPLLGRLFTPEEDRPGRNNVVVLSYGFWMGRYGGDPSVIGRTVRFDGKPTTIVGVLPAGADYPFLWGRVDAWRPLALSDQQRQDRGNNWLNSIGRLKPGVSLRQAQAEMSLLASQLNAAYSRADNPDGLRLVRLAESGMDDSGRRVSWLTLGLAGFVLLIACANIANLQLARMAGRSREYAVRTALGAGRRRILRQALTESLLLGLFGGAAGVLLAWWCNGLMGGSIVIGGQRGVDIPLDWTSLGYALVVSLLAGAISGVVPSWVAARADVNQALKQSLRGGTPDRSQHRMRNAVIVGEMALALVLLAGTSLFVRGLREFTHRDPGWRMDGVLAGTVALPEAAYDSRGKIRAFHQRLQERLEGEPGVEDVTLCWSLPIWSYDQSRNVVAEGRTLPPRGQEPLAYYTAVDSDFFRTLGIPVLAGSVFPTGTRADGPPVAVVNESTARRLWPRESPIGKRLGGPDPESPSWAEVVGVVGDVGYPANLGESDTPLQVYLALVQQPSNSFSIVLRTSVAPDSLAPTLRRAVAEIDPDLPVFEVATPREQTRRILANFSLAGAMLGGFAFLGLLLAALGIYGVIAGVVVQRTSEFGIRVAIGAQVRDILWLVLGRGLRLALWGTAFGLAGAFALSRVLAAAVPSLHSNSTATVLSVSAFLIAVALLACWLPARRAARIDPAVALRYE